MPEPKLNFKYENIHWDGIIHDVNLRFDIIRKCWEATEKEDPAIHEKMVQDIYWPVLKLLGEFVTAVNLEEPK